MLICLLLIFASHLEGQWFNSDKFVFILFSGLLTIELPQSNSHVFDSYDVSEISHRDI